MSRIKDGITFTGQNHKQVREFLGNPDDLNCRGPYLTIGQLGYCQIRNQEGEWISVAPGYIIYRAENGYLQIA